MNFRRQHDVFVSAFSVVIQRLRIERGLTQRDVGRSLNMVENYVSQYENMGRRKRKPGLTFWAFMRFAEAFGLTPAELFDLVEKESRGANK